MMRKKVMIMNLIFYLIDIIKASYSLIQELTHRGSQWKSTISQIHAKNEVKNDTVRKFEIYI